jgi:hypothetical protein
MARRQPVRRVASGVVRVALLAPRTNNDVATGYLAHENERINSANDDPTLETTRVLT